MKAKVKIHQWGNTSALENSRCSSSGAVGLHPDFSRYAEEARKADVFSNFFDIMIHDTSALSVPIRNCDTSDHNYQALLHRSLNTAKMLVELFAFKGITDRDTHELNCAFYTDTEEKSNAVASELQSLGYAVTERWEFEQFIVYARTTPIRMCEKSLREWVTRMCKISHVLGCQFGGWSNDHFGQ